MWVEVTATSRFTIQGLDPMASGFHLATSRLSRVPRPPLQALVWPYLLHEVPGVIHHGGRVLEEERRWEVLAGVVCKREQ